MTALLLWSLAWAAPLTGRVTEHGTTTPVPGAALHFARGDALEVTHTDAAGRFHIDLPDGAWEVTVEAEAFRPTRAALEVPLGRSLSLSLVAEIPLVIVVEAFDASPSITRHRVDAEMARETPGTYEDSVRLVQSLPGVAVQREYAPTAGDLNIRGSGDGDNRYYLDGIELPYLYHFSQYASVFPTSQIDTLDLYASTYGALFGDATGAVIDVTSRQKAPDAIHGSVSLNYVMGGADLTVPLGRKGWWASVAGRRSFLDFASDPDGQYPLWPRFHDFALRAGHHGALTDFQAFVWGAGDAYDRAAGELDVLDPVEGTESARLAYRRHFQVAGAAHRWKDRRARLVAAVVHDRLRGTLSTGGRADLRTVYLTSRYDDTFRLTGDLDLMAGVETRAERTWLEVTEAGREALLVAPEAPMLARGVVVDDALWRVRTGAYAQLRWQPGPLSLMPGVRVHTDTAGAVVRAEPRLAARWRVGPETALKAAGGLYHQSPATEHLFSGSRVRRLPTTRSWQVAGGWEQTFAERLELTVEGYAKWLDDALFYPIDRPAEVAGRGRAWGVELTTRYRLLEVIFLRGWVGIGRSLVERPGVGWTSAAGDQPVVAGAVAAWDVIPPLNVALRYRLGSGLPLTPVVDGLYDATTDTWQPVSGDENSARYPFYQRVDVRVAYTFTFRRWALTLSADVWIVPPSATQLYPTWSYDYSETDWVRGPVVFPVLGAHARF